MSTITIILFSYLAAKLVLDFLQIYTIQTVEIDKYSTNLLEISDQDSDKSREYNVSKLNLSITAVIVPCFIPDS